MDVMYMCTCKCRGHVNPRSGARALLPCLSLWFTTVPLQVNKGRRSGNDVIGIDGVHTCIPDLQIYV